MKITKESGSENRILFEEEQFLSNNFSLEDDIFKMLSTFEQRVIIFAFQK